MNVINTGAGGFPGTHLINFLRKNTQADIKIFCLGKTHNVHCENLYVGSIKNKELINKFISKVRPDYLFHLAGTSNSADNIDQIKLVNTDFSKFLLEAIDKNNLQHKTKILITGTAAEYGKVPSSELPISENLIPKPASVYGKTKYAQTLHALKWQKTNKKLVVVRPFNIIGSNMPKHLALGDFIHQIESISKKGILKTGNINVNRDFIDVYDVVNLMWKLINNHDAYGEVINICSGIGVSVADILDELIKLSDKNITIVNETARLKKNDIPIHFGDNRKLLNIIGKYTFNSWQDTIQKILVN